MLKILLCMVLLLFQSASGDAVILINGALSGSVTEGIVGTSDPNDDGDSREISTTGRMYYTQFTTTTAGTLGYIHVQMSDISSGSNVTVGIWSSTGTLLASGQDTNVTNATGSGHAWVNIALDSTYDISAATDYLLGVMTDDGNWTLWHEADGTDWSVRYIAMTEGSPTSFSTASSSQERSLRDLVIIANNSSGDPA